MYLFFLVQISQHKCQLSTDSTKKMARLHPHQPTVTTLVFQEIDDMLEVLAKEVAWLGSMDLFFP